MEKRPRNSNLPREVGSHCIPHPAPTPLGYDEFGSTVHQQVRQIASAAVASAVRRYGLRFVAVTCHEDVAPWLEADWVMVVDADDVQLHVYRDGARPEPALPSVKLLPRGSLCRPDIHLRVQRCDASAWRIFRRHHYLSAELARTALCWIGMVRCGGGAGRNEPESAGGLNLAGGLNTADPGRAMACLLEAGYRPAAFTAVLPFPHPTRPGWREHRTVCLPEFQGVGIGNAMSELIASIYKRTGRPYFSTTSHPAMIAHRRKSPLWKMVRKPCLKDGHKGAKGRMPGSGDFSAGIDRLTAGFEFVGPPAT